MDLEMQEALRSAAEFKARMNRLNVGLASLREHFKRVPVNDHTPVPIKRAHCHPVLGGVLYKDAKMDVPGPNFGVSSLRRAAKCGELETMWTGGNQLVTGAALRTWIAGQSTMKDKKSAVPTNDYVPPRQRTLHEKSLEDAAMDRAANAFAAIDKMMMKSKSQKKKVR